MTSQLASQVEELKAERKVLLDRLATIGLGGPLFTLPPSPDSSPATESEEESISEKEERALAQLQSLRSKPSMYAAALTRKNARDHKNMFKASGKFQQVTAALDEAEELGKKQA